MWKKHSVTVICLLYISYKTTFVFITLFQIKRIFEFDERFESQIILNVFGNTKAKVSKHTIDLEYICLSEIDIIF